MVLEAGHELDITPTNTGDKQLLKDGSLSSRPAWSIKASSRTGSKATGESCLEKPNNNNNNNNNNNKIIPLKFSRSRITRSFVLCGLSWACSPENSRALKTETCRASGASGSD